MIKLDDAHENLEPPGTITWNDHSTLYDGKSRRKRLFPNPKCAKPFIRMPLREGVKIKNAKRIILFFLFIPVIIFSPNYNSGLEKKSNRAMNMVLSNH